jgi:hypothetical protein
MAGANGTSWKPGQSGNPRGRRRNDAIREDGWRNVFTKLGVRGGDKRLEADFCTEEVSDQQGASLWLGNDIAARIIEKIPEEMMRAGFEVNIQADEENEESDDPRQVAEDMESVCDDLCLSDAAVRALEYERAYGGAAILPIVNDGQDDFGRPLNLDSLVSLSHFVVLEPGELQPVTWYADITRPNFGTPESWRLQPVIQGGTPIQHGAIVHESRMVLFPGIIVTRRRPNQSLTGWGGSILTRVNTVLRDYGVTWESVGAILQEFSQAVYKIKGLAELVAQNQADVVRRRMEILDVSRSILRAVVIDADEDHERKTTTLTGIPEILREFATRLAAAADMPVTVLMGMSPAGLNATGESDIRFFYDRVAGLQRKKLKPKLEQLLRFVFRARTLGPNKEPSPTNGQEPDVWSVQFNKLWEPSQKEQIETRFLQAQADKIYMEDGVLTPMEVRKSRFGGDEYSYKTTADIEATNAMEATMASGELLSVPGQQPAQPNAAPNEPATPDAQKPEVA